MFEQLKTRIRNRNHHQRPSPQFRIRPRLEKLEDRCCPSTGSAQDAWKPIIPGNYYSERLNWTTGHVPVPGSVAIFDGSVSDAPCNVDMDPGAVYGTSPTIPVMFQLQNGYNAQFTIQSGVDCEIGYVDNSPSADNFNVEFASSSAKLDFDAANSFYLYNVSTGGE